MRLISDDFSNLDLTKMTPLAAVGVRKSEILDKSDNTLREYLLGRGIPLKVEEEFLISKERLGESVGMTVGSLLGDSKEIIVWGPEASSVFKFFWNSFLNLHSVLLRCVVCPWVCVVESVIKIGRSSILLPLLISYIIILCLFIYVALFQTGNLLEFSISLLFHFVSGCSASKKSSMYFAQLL